MYPRASAWVHVGSGSGSSGNARPERVGTPFVISVLPPNTSS